jgi:hypothetical protein
LSPNTTTTKKYLAQTGTGTNGAAPAWSQPAVTEISSSTAGGAVYSTASALAVTAAGTSGQVLRSNGSSAPTWEVQGLFSGGRLTLTSVTPVTTSDVTAASSIYYTPYNGDKISLYETASSSWVNCTFTEKTLTLSGLTSGTIYDVFGYLSSNTLALDPPVAWSSTTARSSAISLSNGVYVKTSDTTRRYLGTFRATGTTTTEDSAANRYLWNNNNRILRQANVTMYSSSFSWSGATREWNAGSGVTRLNFINGLNDSPVIVSGYLAVGTGTAGSTVQAGFGIDSTTSFFGTAYTDSQVSGYVVRALTTTGYISGIGYHYMTAVQNASAAANWFGVNGGVLLLS